MAHVNSPQGLPVYLSVMVSSYYEVIVNPTTSRISVGYLCYYLRLRQGVMTKRS